MNPIDLFNECLAHLITDEENEVQVKSKIKINKEKYGIEKKYAKNVSFYNPVTFPSKAQTLLEIIKFAVSEGSEQTLYNKVRNVLENCK